jgi:hypothetical protein
MLQVLSVTPFEKPPLFQLFSAIEDDLIVWPVVDGAAGAPRVFDSTREDAGQPAPLRAMQLLHAESMSDGSVWLRYRLENQT